MALLAGLSTGSVIWVIKSQDLQVTQLQDAISLANSVSQSQEAINKSLDGVKSDEVIRIVSGEIDKIKTDVATEIAGQATAAVISSSAGQFSTSDVDKLKELIGYRGLTETDFPLATDTIMGDIVEPVTEVVADAPVEEVAAVVEEEVFIPFEDIVVIPDVPITCADQTIEVGSDFGLLDVWFNPYLITTGTDCSFVVDIYLEPTALDIDTFRLDIVYPANLLQADSYTLGGVYNLELPGSGISASTGSISIGAYGIGARNDEKTLVASVSFTTLGTGSAKIKFATTSHLLHDGSSYGSYSGLGEMFVTIK